MAVIVSTSVHPDPDHMWMVSNAIYQWLVDLARQQTEADPELISRLEYSRCFSLLSLAKVYAADPELAIRLRALLLALGRDVAAGRHVMRDDNGEVIYEEGELRKAGAELVTLLEKWPGASGTDS